MGGLGQVLGRLGGVSWPQTPAMSHWGIRLGLQHCSCVHVASRGCLPKIQPCKVGVCRAALRYGAGGCCTWGSAWCGAVGCWASSLHSPRAQRAHIRWGCLRQAAAEGCISAGIFFFPFLKAVSSLKAVFCTSASEESGENLGRVLLAGELQLLLCVLAAGAAEIA